MQSATKQTTKPEVSQVSSRPRGSIELVAEKKPFQSRFLPNHQTPKKDETESSSSEEESTSEESDDDEEEQMPKTSTPVSGSNVESKRSSRGEVPNSRSGGYSSSTYALNNNDLKSPALSPRSRANQHIEYEDHSSRYGPGSSR